MSGGSRVSMISSAAALIGARGLSGTSFSDVLADSGAPRGSIYHHFPGGKKQLAADVIQWTSDQILGYLRACPADTPEGVLAWFIDLWRQSVLTSGGCGGCPVAGVAMDADDEELTAAARAAFAAWTALLAEQLEAVGVPEDRARPVASVALTAMEGALVMCRVERSVEPLETTAAELLRLLAGGLRADLAGQQAA
jgi:TetR/AcrR family transcriptional regulator, lmrAB and yxaGH operons repressor